MLFLTGVAVSSTSLQKKASLDFNQKNEKWDKEQVHVGRRGTTDDYRVIFAFYRRTGTAD